MQGLNKQVIEIVDTGSESIDRVIVILKPGFQAAGNREKNRELEDILGGLQLCRKCSHARLFALLALLAAAALAVFFALRLLLPQFAAAFCLSWLNML